MVTFPLFHKTSLRSGGGDQQSFVPSQPLKVMDVHVDMQLSCWRNRCSRDFLLFFVFSVESGHQNDNPTTTRGQNMNNLYLSLDNGKNQCCVIKLSKVRLLPFSSKTQNRNQHGLVAVRCERILLPPILNLTCVSWKKYMSTPIGAKQYQLKNNFPKKSTADADFRLQARSMLKARRRLIFGERKYYTFFVHHAQICTSIWKRALVSVEPTIFFCASDKNWVHGSLSKFDFCDVCSRYLVIFDVVFKIKIF